MTNRVAVYAGTRNLYPDMMPALRSLLAHDGADRVYLLIEDDTFPEPLPACVRVINVRDQRWFEPGGPNYRSRWTWMVLMRAALTKVLPTEARVLSLDVDTIVTGDISGLWETDLSGCYLSAAREPAKSAREPYYQMGVVLFNLTALRADGKDDEIIGMLNTRRYEYCEQDCINELCRGRIRPMDSRYNANAYTEPTDDPRILHFAAIGRWNRLPQVEKYRRKGSNDDMA